MLQHLKIAALIVCTALTAMAVEKANGKLKVFILAGQSNMQGHGRSTGVDVTGSLDWLVESFDHVDEFHPYVNGNREHLEHENVWVYYSRENHTNYGVIDVLTGPLAPRFGFKTGEPSIGPEFSIGLELDKHYEDQVLLIKACWGGHSLGENFRPPGSGGTLGPSYTRMLEIVTDVTENLDTYFTDYDGAGFEIKGFAWHQGFNDQFCDGCRAEYAENLENLIDDLRAEWEVPELPVSIGESGMICANREDEICDSQQSVAELAKYDGSVSFVPTTQFYLEEMGPGAGYHWYESFWSYYKVGEEMGKAMVDLLQIPGCMDEGYEEFDSTATLHDSTACITVGTRNRAPLESSYTIDGPLLTFYTNGAHQVQYLDVSGTVVKQHSGTGRVRYQMYRQLPSALYFVRIVADRKKSVIKLVVP